MLLSFVQFEHPGRLGLSDGRYVIRDPAAGEFAAGKATPDRVLVVQTLGAPHPDRSKRRRPRRTRAAESPPQIPDVPVTRATVAQSTPFGDEAEAKQWLTDLAADPKRRAESAREGLDVLNRALDTLRRAAEDPLVGDASFHHALVIRVGYGSGEQLADGAWTQARELPPSPVPRHHDLDAQRRAALELAGKDPDANEDDEDED
jgi:hypothetical protein